MNLGLNNLILILTALLNRTYNIHLHRPQYIMDGAKNYTK